MATYKDLKGFKIKSLSSDPTTDLGQIWYNTTSNTLKFDGVGAGTWASSTAVPATLQAPMGFGSSTAGMLAAGISGTGLVGGTNQLKTYSWNGSSWTELADVNLARRQGAGCGASSTSGMISGGVAPGGNTNAAEEYNGTSWASLTAMGSPRTGCNMSGIVTAAITFCGESFGGLAELWNGSTWTEVAEVNTPRGYVGSAFKGPTTAAMVIGGSQPGATGPPSTLMPFCEQYNGTSWSEEADLNTGRNGGMGAGDTAAALYAGGNIAPYPLQRNEVETYDGTSWTEVTDMATDRRIACRSNGSSTAALVAAGSVPPMSTWSASAELWDGAPAGVQTVTVS